MDSVHGLDKFGINQINGAANKLILFSKFNPLFRIEGGPKIIEACSILKNVTKFALDNDPIEVGMTLTQLKKFVELHNHFGENDPWDKKDDDWVIPFFSKMSDDEFKELCQNADYLDSQRFLNNAANFLIWKLERMEYQDIQKYLNIVDDYTIAERSAMESDSIKFFTSIILKPLKNAQRGKSKFLRFIPSDSSSVFEKTEFIAGHQNFAFPMSLMYFTFNASRMPANVFFKLYYTCKYFFLNLKLIPCIGLNAMGNDTNHELTIICGNRTSNIPFENIKTMHANFYVRQQVILQLKCPPKLCHKFLSKITRHDISTACICHENLTLTVMQFKDLFSNVTDLALSFVKVIHPNEKEVTLDQLLSYIPNAISVKIQTSSSTECFTSSTIQKIAENKRETKFISFTLKTPPIRYLYGDDFALFIKNHANPSTTYTNFNIIFDNYITEEFVSNFKSDVLKILDSWNPKSVKPTLMLRTFDRVLFVSDSSSPF